MGGVYFQSVADSVDFGKPTVRRLVHVEMCLAFRRECLACESK